MRVFFDKPWKDENGSIFVGREWVFEKKSCTIHWGWIPKYAMLKSYPYDMYATFKEIAKEGAKGDPYEEVLERVIKYEPDSQMKKNFIRLLKRKIKERDAKLGGK